MDPKTYTEHDSKVMQALSNVLKLAAVPAGAITGYYAWDASARNFVYKNFASRGFLTDLQKKHKKDWQNTVQKVRAEGSLEIADKLEDIIENYRSKELRPFFNEMGINSQRKLYKVMTHNQKIETGVLAFTAATMVAGGLLMIANNRGMLDLFAKHDKEQNGKTAL
jgi:hypothetical protein